VEPEGSRPLTTVAPNRAAGARAIAFPPTSRYAARRRSHDPLKTLLFGPVPEHAKGWRMAARVKEGHAVDGQQSICVSHFYDAFAYQYGGQRLNR
jgi:hypothetical protein